MRQKDGVDAGMEERILLRRDHANTDHTIIGDSL